jgi:diacylglycerol kinase family enzyme
MTRPLLLVSRRAARLADPRTHERTRAAAIESIREREGRDPEVVDAGDAAEAGSALADAIARGTSLVVVAGGDGSVRTAAGALAGTAIPLGIIPAGAGNLFASALRLPRTPFAAATRLGRASVRPCDIGSVETAAGRETFVVACGMGFDARVMAATSGGAKARFGVAAYFGSALDAARRTHGAITRISADGESLEVTAIATLVANAGEIIPGLLGPREPIRPDDGWLDVIAVTGETAIEGAIAGIGLLLDRTAPPAGAVANARGAVRIRAREVSVSTEPAEPIEIDGDVVVGASGRLTATVSPGAILVLVP